MHISGRKITERSHASYKWKQAAVHIEHKLDTRLPFELYSLTASRDTTGGTTRLQVMTGRDAVYGVDGADRTEGCLAYLWRPE